MDFSWLEAVPVGFVLFGGTLFAVLRRKMGRRSAKRGYPKVAEQLGLNYEPPSHDSEVGSLKGTYRGFPVSVLPEHTRIVVTLPRRSLIDLRNYTHWKRQPAHLEGFSFGLRWADQWLQGRYCDPALAERIHQEPAWAEILGKLRVYQQRLKQLTIEGERLECVLDYGSPPHIPANTVAAIVPLLVAMAEQCMLASEQAS